MVHKKDIKFNKICILYNEVLKKNDILKLIKLAGYSDDKYLYKDYHIASVKKNINSFLHKGGFDIVLILDQPQNELYRSIKIPHRFITVKEKED